MSENYKNLIVWQKAMDLVVEIYKLANKFPNEERYGLRSQITRCAISIPSNIAEGSRRETTKDTRHFLIIAFSSGAELETQLEIIKRIKLVKDIDYSRIDTLLSEIMKMLNKMTR